MKFLGKSKEISLPDEEAWRRIEKLKSKENKTGEEIKEMLELTKKHGTRPEKFHERKLGDKIAPMGSGKLWEK